MTLQWRNPGDITFLKESWSAFLVMTHQHAVPPDMSDQGHIASKAFLIKTPNVRLIIRKHQVNAVWKTLCKNNSPILSEVQGHGRLGKTEELSQTGGDWRDRPTQCYVDLGLEPGTEKGHSWSRQRGQHEERPRAKQDMDPSTSG